MILKRKTTLGLIITSLFLSSMIVKAASDEEEHEERTGLCDEGGPGRAVLSQIIQMVGKHIKVKGPQRTRYQEHDSEDDGQPELEDQLGSDELPSVQARRDGPSRPDDPYRSSRGLGFERSRGLTLEQRIEALSFALAHLVTHNDFTQSVFEAAERTIRLEGQENPRLVMPLAVLVLHQYHSRRRVSSPEQISLEPQTQGASAALLAQLPLARGRGQNSPEGTSIRFLLGFLGLESRRSFPAYNGRQNPLDMFIENMLEAALTPSLTTRSIEWSTFSDEDSAWINRSTFNLYGRNLSSRTFPVFFGFQGALHHILPRMLRERSQPVSFRSSFILLNMARLDHRIVNLQNSRQIQSLEAEEDATEEEGTLEFSPDVDSEEDIPLEDAIRKNRRRAWRLTLKAAKRSESEERGPSHRPFS